MIVIVYILCILLSFQDFKHRLVNLYLLIALFGLNLIVGYQKVDVEIIEITLTNLAMLVFLLTTLFIYYSLKNRKLHDITDKEFGKGDMVMLAVFSPSFSSSNYLMIVIISAILGIIFFVISKSNTIPFAGIVAAVFIVLETLNQLSITNNYYNFLI